MRDISYLNKGLKAFNSCVCAARYQSEAIIPGD